MGSDSREPGAPPVPGVVPLCIPHLGGNEWKYLQECLETNFVSSVGPFVDRFEEMVAGYVGVSHAVATVNGTSALHVALLVAGVRPDDEVLVSTLSFIAPANAIRYAGAWPVFVDAEPDFWQMDVRKLVEFVEERCELREGELRNRETGRRVSAVVPVHILGHPVDMDPLVETARRYGLAVVEDATESLVALYDGRKVGSLGDIACFSFNGNKLITTGGGGMIVTANREWADRARYLTTQAKDDPIEYVHGEVGYNYRLTNLQAAVGCAQMERLDERVAEKRRIAGHYSGALAGVEGLNPMREASWARSAFWLYTVLVDRARTGYSASDLMKHLDEQGIQTRPLWQPLHRSPAHRGSPRTDCSVAEAIQRRALSLPCSVGMSDEDQARVVEAIAKAGT